MPLFPKSEHSQQLETADVDSTELTGIERLVSAANSDIQPLQKLSVVEKSTLPCPIL